MLSIAAVALATLLSSALTTLIPADLKPNAQKFSVPLSGGAELNPGQAGRLGGDMDGSGRVELTVDPAGRQVCYDFALSNLATPLMAHIHKGAEQRNGPSVVTLFTGPGADLIDCVPWTEKWLAAIVDDPAGFYVNVYTTEYPDGAVRGQLVA